MITAITKFDVGGSILTGHFIVIVHKMKLVNLYDLQSRIRVYLSLVRAEKKQKDLEFNIFFCLEKIGEYFQQI